MNEKKRSPRYKKIVEAVKTCVLLLLVITLIGLVVVYIRGTRVFENAVSGKDGPGKSFDKLWSVLGGIEPEGLDNELLIPEFIGYKQSMHNASRGCVGDYESTAELYSIIKPCILELFGKDSVCRKLPESVGSKMFLAAQQSEEYVYLSYHTPVLYQLVYAYAADTLAVSADEVAASPDGDIGAYIGELIVIPDNNFAAHRFIAYAYDPVNGYYEFRPGDHVVASDFYISKLSDSEDKTVPFEFLFDSVRGPGKPVVTEQIECDVISTVPAEIPTGEVFDEFLRFFGYNPDKLDVFADDDEGSAVYIDSHSRLKISSEQISFVTSDAYGTSGEYRRGLEIDNLLGYSSEGAATLFDKLTAVDNLVGRLGEFSNQLVGGDGMLCLGDVYSDGSLLVIEYLLTYDNIVVDIAPYLRAVLTDDTVCEVEICADTVRVLDQTSSAASPDYVIRGLKSVGRVTDDAVISTVYLGYGDGKARWNIELSE